MTVYGLYWGLLVLWVPLLWPALQLRGAARVWLLLVIAGAFVALLHETRMFLFSPAAIRLDIILISVALVTLYGSAAALLLIKRWTRLAASFAIALLVLGGGMSYAWVDAGRESERVRAAFEEGNRLLFEAKFRSEADYQRHFGPFPETGEDLPTGHWRAEASANFTRLIVNAQGRAWLFYRCQSDAECHFGPGGTGLRAVPGGPQQWQASLQPRAGQALDVSIIRTGAGMLSVAVRNETLRFSKAPPPIEPEPAPHALAFHGAFASVRAGARTRPCIRFGYGVTTRANWRLACSPRSSQASAASSFRPPF